MNHHLVNLSSLLNANQSQLNVANLNEISNERENAINEASDNSSCSSTINVRPLLIQKSNRFKVNSSFKNHKCQTCNKRFLTATQLTTETFRL